MAALEETDERQHDLSSSLYDSLSNIITVLTLRLEGRMEQSLTGKIGAIEPPFRREIRINEWKWFVASMLIAGIYLIITTGYIHQHYMPGVVFYVGGLVTLLGYVNQFTSMFNDVAWQYTQIMQFNTDVQTARQIGDAYHEHHQPEPASLPNGWNRLSVSNLNYEHPVIPGLNEHQPASLKSLSINLQRGKRVALIGESGSGKSTLLTLLRGLNSPIEGITWSVDGETRTDWLAIGNTVTLFPQEPEIFENTALCNITLGLPFTDAEVAGVCQIARFADVAAYLPNGLDTLIQEKGVNLSGGQKQRLALARGLLAARQSDIILLDEPTSSVDPKTEFHIYHALLATFADKAVVSSLHRLHLLPLFDYIYILDKGRIADEGTFVDLRQRSILFQDMWRHQSDALNRINGVEA